MEKLINKIRVLLKTNRFKTIFPTSKRSLIWVFLGFVLISIYFLREAIFSAGLIIGEDLAYPLTNIQIKTLFDIGRYTWDFNQFVPYRNFSTGASSWIQGLQLLLSIIGISGEIFIKFLIIFIFAFAAFSMYQLLKYLKMNIYIAFLGGLFYITTPIFFNYTIMGWYFVLFTMGLLPLAVIYFMRSVQEKKIRYAVISGLVFAVSFTQSQSLIWYPMVFIALGPYLINDKHSLKSYLKTLAIVVFTFTILNFHIILPLIIISDQAVSGSDYINAPASLGTVANFYPINIIRLWGSLFNNQYETVSKQFNLIFISFFIPFVALASIFIKKERKLIISLWLIGLIPFGMYFLIAYRDLLLYIPFANLIRDFARFSILSVFAYAILTSLSFKYLFYEIQKLKSITLKFAIMGLLVIIGFFYLKPWWSGEIGKWQHKIGVDSRMSTQKFPESYYTVENLLENKKIDARGLYLPSAFNGVIKQTDDPKYSGGVRDIFAIFSPIPGLLTSTDRNLGVVTYSNLLLNSVNDQLIELIRQTNMKYIIVRKDMSPIIAIDNIAMIENILNQQVKQGSYRLDYDSKEIMVFEKVEFLPHFYVPRTLVSWQNVNLEYALKKIIDLPNYQTRIMVTDKNQKNMQNMASKMIFLFGKNYKNNSNNFTSSAENNTKASYSLNRFLTPDTMINFKYNDKQKEVSIETIPIKTIKLNREILNEKPFTLAKFKANAGDVFIQGDMKININNKLNYQTTARNLSETIKIAQTINTSFTNISFEEGPWAPKVADCSIGNPGKANIAMNRVKDATKGQYSLEIRSKNHDACTGKNFKILLKKGGIYKLSFDYKNVIGTNVQYRYDMTGPREVNYPFSETIKAKNHNWNHLETYIQPLENIHNIGMAFYATSDGKEEVVNRIDNIELKELSNITPINVSNYPKSITIQKYKGIKQNNITEYLPSTNTKLWSDSFENDIWQKEPIDCSNNMIGKAEFNMGQVKDSTKGKFSMELGSQNHHICTYAGIEIQLFKNKIYKLSFDYKNIKGEKVQYYYNIIGKGTNKTLSETINAKNQNWNHFETFIEPMEDVHQMFIYFYAPSDGKEEVINRFDNVQIEEVFPKDLFNYYLYSPAVKNIKTPIVEFKKINPIKYRVRIHGAKENFPLVFNESFHEKWKLYPTKYNAKKISVNDQLPKDYKIFKTDENDQANVKELSTYLAKGMITDVGNGKIILNKNGEDKQQKHKVSFISKVFNGTIQNDNFSNGMFYETYFKNPLPEIEHMQVNGYANAWWIDINELKKSNYVKLNQDGTYDIELVVEFWPQKIYYIGLFLSSLFLLSVIIYLIISRKGSYERNQN